MKTKMRRKWKQKCKNGKRKWENGNGNGNENVKNFMSKFTFGNVLNLFVEMTGGSTYIVNILIQWISCHFRTNQYSKDSKHFRKQKCKTKCKENGNKNASRNGKQKWKQKWKQK